MCDRDPVNQTGPVLHVTSMLSHHTLVWISEGFIPSLLLMSPTLLTEGQVSRAERVGHKLKTKAKNSIVSK